MLNVSLEQIPAMSAEDAEILTGCAVEDFDKPGVYHVILGSRGEVEEFNFLGDVKTVELPTLEELQAQASDQDERDYYAEFYGVFVEHDHINFGYVEEGYDVYLRI